MPPYRLKKLPTVVQLPGGVRLRGVPFRITRDVDGSPLSFELLPSNFTPVKQDDWCVLFCSEEWIRSPDPKRASV